MVSEIQSRQTFSRRPPTHPNAHSDTMGENNTLTALKGCGVKTKSVAVLLMSDFYRHIFLKCSLWKNQKIS